MSSRNSYKLALQAVLCYNEGRKLLCSKDALTSLERLIHLRFERRCIVNTVPHSANDSNVPHAPGIYKITCTANNKVYIGSTINLYKRRRQHFTNLRLNKHINTIMQHAWNKHGAQTFTFEVLELVLPMSLTVREQYWFNKLKPYGKNGFNIAREAGSPMLGRKHTPETRERLRRSSIGKNLGKKRTFETREKLRQYRLGRKHTPEHIEKQRQALLGRKQTPEAIEKNRQAHLGKKMTPESIEKTRLANIGRKHTPEQIEKRKQSLATKGGYKHSPETLEKMRQANLGRKRSPEAIENMRQSRWGKNKLLDNE